MDIRVYTEFTSLSDPRLIAICAVSGETRAFYGIVSNFPKSACTRFVIEHVLLVLDANPASAFFRALPWRSKLVPVVIARCVHVWYRRRHARNGVVPE